MSWGTCYSGSNNIHFNSPPIMHDGRNYATWQSGATINENLRKEKKITHNWEYRKYLIDNADTIIKSNQKNACDNCSNCSLEVNEVKNTQTPFLYNAASNKKTQPYGYENSDLKNLYLSRQELHNKITPVFTEEQLVQNFFTKKV